MASYYSSDVSTDVTLTTTAETVVATLTGVSSQRAGQSVDIDCHFAITLGTGTTAVVLRVREDSLTGNVVDEAETDQISTAAGSAEDHDFHATHRPTGELSGKTYVFTVSQTAATANGTVTHASMEANLTP